MAHNKNGVWFYIVGAVVIGLVSYQVGKGSSSRTEQEKPLVTAEQPTPSTPTPPPSTSVAVSTPLAQVLSTPIPVPTASPTPPLISETITTYQVAGVPAGDFLNLRTGPSQSSSIIQKLQNGVDGITLLGDPVNNAGTVWQKVDSRGIEGWVVGTYLVPGTLITVKPAVVAATQATPVKEPNPPSDNYIPKEVRLTTSTAFPVFTRGVQTGLAAPPIGTKVKFLKVTGYNVLVEFQGQQKSISAASTDLLQRMLGTSDD